MVDEAPTRSFATAGQKIIEAASWVMNHAALAAWVQAIIAGMAVCLAYGTLNSWKVQELTKRQAEVASVLMIKLNSLSSTFLAMWPEARSYDEAELLAESSILKSVYANPLYFQFLAQARELKSYAGVVSGTIDNEPLREGIANLVGDAEALANCVQHIRQLDRAPDPEKRGDIWKQRAISALAAISIMPKGKVVKRNQNACNFDFDIVLQDIKRVEDRSAGYLRFSQ